MPNRLAEETSPYLLQHANNPVDWQPWGPQALERARAENKPIFLSIGYSACHWCHVMEHESFEDPDIARFLNDNFVSIKVDREERPDLDQIYMQAVQAMTGRGGWPMSVFLTAELKPFYGGTYWPPSSRMGMPGFDDVLAAVRDAWHNRRPAVDEQAEQLTGHLRQAAGISLEAGPLDPPALLRNAAVVLERSCDRQHGGFGSAPKFPHPMDLRVLLRAWRRTGRDELLQIATLTLDKMAGGGMYDQLGGGFHRYSVDERWLVPHFEKMLYDNALLAVAYVEAWQATGREDYARVTRETLDYVLREMTGPEGGFYSTLDADSEGEEGKFYVWTPSEIAAVLGPERAQMFCQAYDVSEPGNFEGHNILNLPKTFDQLARLLSRDRAELERELTESRAQLLAVRNSRIWPALDDKVLVSWNGLMIDAMAQAGAALGEPRYIAAAVKAADFLLSQLRRHDGRLLHCWRNDTAKLDAYLDDYACLANALVSLYEATFDERWIDAAVPLAAVLIEQFEDHEHGGFFYTATDHETLIARQKDLQDSSVPSGNAMAALLLVRLGKLCGRSDYLDSGRRAMEACLEIIKKAPSAAGQLLIAVDFLQGPTPEIVILSPQQQSATQAVLGNLRRRFWPNKVVALRPAASNSVHLAGLFAGKDSPVSEPTVYLCENFTCRQPLVGEEAILAGFGR